MRDLVRIKCCIVLQKLNCHHVGSPTLPPPGRQISGYPPASSSRTVLTRIPFCCLFFVASPLSPHLARFLARSVGRPCFCLRDPVGLTVGLAIGGTVSMARKVAVGLSG